MIIVIVCVFLWEQRSSLCSFLVNFHTVLDSLQFFLQFLVPTQRERPEWVASHERVSLVTDWQYTSLTVSLWWAARPPVAASWYLCNVCGGHNGGKCRTCGAHLITIHSGSSPRYAANHTAPGSSSQSLPPLLPWYPLLPFLDHEVAASEQGREKLVSAVTIW